MATTTTILRAAAIVGLLGSTASVASAQQTRSATAVPASQAAPTSGVRSATALKKKSGLASEAVIPAILGAAIVAGGIYIAVDDSNDDDDGFDSPG